MVAVGEGGEVEEGEEECEGGHVLTLAEGVGLEVEDYFAGGVGEL